MSSRLLQLLSKPIAEAERQRLFAVAVAVLLVVAGTLQVIEPAGKQARSIAPHPTTTAVVRAAAPSEPAGPSTVVTRAGREFLADYLAFVHGQAPTTFRHASAPLARRLAGYALRISPATRARRAQVLRVAVRRLSGQSRWLMTATIADGGVATYPLELVVVLRARGAVIVQVGED
jgi:hypothetical protein